MDSKVKERVDEFWTWVEKERKTDAFALFFVPSPKTLKELKLILGLIVPTRLKHGYPLHNTFPRDIPARPETDENYDQWDIGRTLPIPPNLVTGIGKDDVDYLKRALGLKKTELCYKLCIETYRALNAHFLKEGQSREAIGIIQGLIQKGVSAPRLIVIVGEISQSEQGKKRRTSPAEMNRWYKKRIKELNEYKKLLLAVPKGLRMAIEAADRLDTTTHYRENQLPGEVGRWLLESISNPKKDLVVLLDDVEKVIESEYLRALKYNRKEPSVRQFDYAPNAQKGLLALEDLLVEAEYSQKTAATIIMDLFDQMGVPLGSPNRERDRQRTIESLRQNLIYWRTQREKGKRKRGGVK